MTWFAVGSAAVSLIGSTISSATKAGDSGLGGEKLNAGLQGNTKIPISSETNTAKLQSLKPKTSLLPPGGNLDEERSARLKAVRGF